MSLSLSYVNGGYSIYISDDDEQKEEGDKLINNQGRDHCYKCGARTVKVETGMFTIYDICPKCKI